MDRALHPHRAMARPARAFRASLVAAVGVLSFAACSRQASVAAPSPRVDPRVGLRAGLMDAGEAVSNLNVLSRTAPPKEFLG